MCTQFGKKNLLNYSPYCSFNIFVPKAVDQRVKHRTQKDIKNSCTFGLFYGCLRRRPQIHPEQCPIKHSDNCQMRPTGGECLAPPFWRMHLQNGCKDGNVRNEDDGERAHEVGTSHHEHGSLIDISV